MEMFVSPTFSAVAGAWAGSFFAMAKDPEATEMAAKKTNSRLLPYTYMVYTFTL
ncbi:hypothetical protein QG37_00515 [Candidozyma auris]|nr:hypothetical protein QG37_00515 [[Candida] auris]